MLNKKRILALSMVFVLLFGTLAASGDAQTIQQTSQMPKYVFYFIGDGLGASQRQLAEYYLRQTTGDNLVKLTMNTFPIAGINTTYSNDTLVTDSAAAGTALATGIKTNNGIISQTSDGKNVKTLVECAEQAGMATGLVTTTRITHATPAVFASHNISRNDENAIAVDYLDSGVDFFAGGGLRNFLPQGWKDAQTDAAGNTIKSKRKDDRNLLNEFSESGYNIFYGMNGAQNFKKYTPKEGDKAFAVFTYSHNPYEIDRVNQNYEVPSLAQMTEKAIQLLSKDADGFFLMVEGGRIDHACHINDAAGSIQDTIAFDDAIKEAYEFYLTNPNETLIVVVGDHETGGMGLGFATNYFLDLNQLDNVKVSAEDQISGKYKGDREEFLSYLEQNCGLVNITADELTALNKAMDLVDAETIRPENGYKYDEAALAAEYVIAERVNIQWTTYAHTGTAIPMSAVGVGAENFGGFKDNTDIAKTMAELMEFKLSN